MYRMLEKARQYLISPSKLNKRIPSSGYIQSQIHFSINTTCLVNTFFIDYLSCFQCSHIFYTLPNLLQSTTSHLWKNSPSNNNFFCKDNCSIKMSCILSLALALSKVIEKIFLSIVQSFKQ